MAENSTNKQHQQQRLELLSTILESDPCDEEPHDETLIDSYTFEEVLGLNDSFTLGHRRLGKAKESNIEDANLSTGTSNLNRPELQAVATTDSAKEYESDDSILIDQDPDTDVLGGIKDSFNLNQRRLAKKANGGTEAITKSASLSMMPTPVFQVEDKPVGGRPPQA